VFAKSHNYEHSPGVANGGAVEINSQQCCTDYGNPNTT